MLRGDVHAVVLRRDGGHELAGSRYGVVVQSDVLGLRSTVILAPTSASVQPARFRPEIELRGRRSRVVVDHLRVIDVRKVGRRMGRLTSDELADLDEALHLVLGLL